MKQEKISGQPTEVDEATAATIAGVPAEGDSSRGGAGCVLC